MPEDYFSTLHFERKNAVFPRSLASGVRSVRTLSANIHVSPQHKYLFHTILSKGKDMPQNSRPGLYIVTNS